MTETTRSITSPVDPESQPGERPIDVAHTVEPQGTVVVVGPPKDCGCSEPQP